MYIDKTAQAAAIGSFISAIRNTGVFLNAQGDAVIGFLMFLLAIAILYLIGQVWPKLSYYKKIVLKKLYQETCKTEQ